MKLPIRSHERAILHGATAALSSSRTSFCRNWHRIRLTPTGCRGITGPVPPPLWIRVPIRAIELSRDNTTGQCTSQLMATFHASNKKCGVTLSACRRIDSDSLLLSCQMHNGSRSSERNRRCKQASLVEHPGSVQEPERGSQCGCLLQHLGRCRL